MADRNEKIERLRKRHKAAPESKAFAPLADLLRVDGQVEEALGLLEDGLSRYPDYLTAMVILGHTLLDANRHDHARKVLVRVLDLDPDNFVALRLLAEDASEQEIWNLAAPWLERLTVLEPQEKVWRQMLDKALAHLPANTVVPDSSSPSDEGFATMTMVDIYMEQGYYSKALAALKLIQARNPGRPDVKARLVEVLAKLDEPGGHPSANGPDAPVTRSQDMAARRTREKQRFAEWLDGFQPENGSQS